MEIKLERNISVESYEAIMKIASFNEKYGYILPVLKLEEEGGITAEQVNTKLFNQKPDHLMGNRLLDRIAKYRLIEQYHGTFKQTAVAETLTVHYNSSHIVSYNSSHIVSYNSSHIVSDYHLTQRGEKLFKLLQETNSDKIDAEIIEKLQQFNMVISVTKLPTQIYTLYSYSLTSLGQKLVDYSWPYTPEKGLEEELFIYLESKGFLEKNPSPENEIHTATEYETISNEYNYKLTELGRKALEDGKVPIPEKGLFVIYTTKDPLFREKLIAYEPKKEKRRRDFKDKAYNQQNNNKKKEKGSKKSESPKWLNQIINSPKISPKIIRLAAQNGEEIQLIKVEDQVNLSEQKKGVSIALRITSGHNPQMEVTTSTNGKNSTYVCKPNMEMTVLDVLKHLLLNRVNDIIEFNQSPALLVNFNEIKDNLSEIHSGKRELKIKSPEIKGFGRFNDVRIEDLILIPRSLDDAILWANSLVSGSIEYFIDEDAFNTLCDKAVERFSGRFDFNEIRKGIRSFDEMKRELIAEKESNPQKYWYVTAPEVLTFRGVR